MIRGLVAILLSAILTDNYVLVKFLGICPFLGVSQKVSTAMGMSTAVTFVMFLATAVTWPIYQYILEPNGFGYLQTIVFIIIIAVLVQFVETVLKKFMPSLYKALGIYLPLITTNCAVLGVTLLVIDKGAADASYGYVQALVNSVGSGLGFMLAMFLFAGVREKMEASDIPVYLKGLPITLIAASLLAVSFLGFQGVVDGMLG